MRTRALVILLCCLAVVGCHDDKVGVVYSVSKLCVLVDGNGNPVNGLNFTNNDLVSWKNDSDNVIKIIASDSKVLGGRNSIRIAPGEKVTVRVGRTLGESVLTWHCVDLDDEDGGGGGSVPVNTGGGGGGD